jgi:surface protein
VQADCVIVAVGSHNVPYDPSTDGYSGSATKTVTVPQAGLICPTTVNKDNWIGGFTYGDTFNVEVSGDQVMVTRDNFDSWGMNLKFACCELGTPSACQIENGQSINAEPCLCGLKTCTVNTGLFCYSNQNYCSSSLIATCQHVNGISQSSDDCLCGTVMCTSTTGYFCKSVNNLCSHKPITTFTPQNLGELVNAVKSCTGESPGDGSCPVFASTNDNGVIGDWDISRVTSLDSVFYNCAHFNADISKWDTSRVTSMGNTFRGCPAFNADLSKWDTSRVTSFTGIFRGASTFNSDISKWNTSNTENFWTMFYSAYKFNGDVSKWDGSKVSTFGLMFIGASDFNLKWCNPTWHGKIGKSDLTPQSMHKCCNPGKYNKPILTTPFITCHNCPPGQFTADLSIVTECSICPQGWYQKESEKQFCFPCLPGKTNDLAGQDDCKECVIGKFMSTTESDASECNECLEGKYQDETSKAVCKSCPAGKYKNNKGGGSDFSCILCRIGRYSSAEAAISEATCRGCAKGKQGKGLTGESREQDACEDCEMGLYRNKDMNACENCPAGFYQKILGQASCFPCIPGKYQDLPGESSCKKCLPNTESRNANSTKCDNCGIGQKSEAGSAKCTKCDAGEAGTGTNGG